MYKHSTTTTSTLYMEQLLIYSLHKNLLGQTAVTVRMYQLYPESTCEQLSLIPCFNRRRKCGTLACKRFKVRLRNIRAFLKTSDIATTNSSPLGTRFMWLVGTYILECPISRLFCVPIFRDGTEEFPSGTGRETGQNRDKILLLILYT